MTRRHAVVMRNEGAMARRLLDGRCVRIFVVVDDCTQDRVFGAGPAPLVVVRHQGANET
jgi:hypothetical protein